jgi:hypothetical protein
MDVDGSYRGGVSHLTTAHLRNGIHRPDPPVAFQNISLSVLFDATEPPVEKVWAPVCVAVHIQAKRKYVCSSLPFVHLSIIIRGQEAPADAIIIIVTYSRVNGDRDKLDSTKAYRGHSPGALHKVLQ